MKNPSHYKHRALSTVHKWFSLMDSDYKEINQFLKLCDKNFSIKIPLMEKDITHEKPFTEWLILLENLIEKSNHEISDFNCTLIENNRLKVNFYVKWNGTNKNHQKMIAETKQEWILNNNNDHPLICNILIDTVIPLKIIENEIEKHN